MKKLNDLSPDELKPDKPSFFARMFGKLSGSVQGVLSKVSKNRGPNRPNQCKTRSEQEYPAIGYRNP